MTQHMLAQSYLIAERFRHRRRRLINVSEETQFFQNIGGSTILVSFWDEGTKPVLLLDTFLRSGEMDEQSGKAELVVHYNANKSGVDVMDKMIRHYSSKRKCNRWPVSFFFNLVDICLSNTCILMAKLLDVTGRERKAFHLKTIKDVGYAMVEPHIRGRMASYANPPLSLKTAWELCGFRVEIASESQAQQPRRRRRCQKCYVKSVSGKQPMPVTNVTNLCALCMLGLFVMNIKIQYMKNV